MTATPANRKAATIAGVVLLVAALAAFETWHELRVSDEIIVGDQVCSDPSAGRSTLADALTQHAQSHR